MNGDRTCPVAVPARKCNRGCVGFECRQRDEQKAERQGHCPSCSQAGGLHFNWCPAKTRDACEFCLGVKGGVPGNENRIGGHIVCDYCTPLAHSLQRSMAARGYASMDPQRQRELAAERMTEMVDAAMAEMSNIHPPIRRSECERLIRAALGALEKPHGR